MNRSRRVFRSYQARFFRLGILLVTLTVAGALVSWLPATANSQIIKEEGKKKKKREKKYLDIKPGESLNYKVNPDGTKSGLSVRSPKKMIFADCATRSRDKGMWLLDEKGDTIQHVSSRGGYASWASDRVRMVCIDPRLNMKVLALDQPGKGLIIGTPNHLTPEMPAWSPRADVVAFGAVDKYDVRQIFVVDVNAEATGLKQLTNDTVSSYMPSWNTDGTMIVFSRHQGKKGLYSVSPTGGEVKPFFVSESFFLTETHWSKDGKYLVGTDRGGGNIIRLDADGTNPINLTKIGTRDAHFGNPRFIDGGSKIIFAGKSKSKRRTLLFTISINPSEDELPVEFIGNNNLTWTYASPNW